MPGREQAHGNHPAVEVQRRGLTARRPQASCRIKSRQGPQGLTDRKPLPDRELNRMAMGTSRGMYLTNRNPQGVPNIHAQRQPAISTSMARHNPQNTNCMASHRAKHRVTNNAPSLPIPSQNDERRAGRTQTCQVRIRCSISHSLYGGTIQNLQNQRF